MYLWKSMKKGLRSGYDNSPWKTGEWRKIKGEPKLCDNGFHASRNIIDAMQYTNLENLAKVEVRGKSVTTNDKQVWTEMRIVKAWKWTKKDSVALAIYAANLVLHQFEEKYPDDKRPRLAIEAARAWVKNPTKENQVAARSAAESARSAAWSVESAARPAWSAAESAARSAARSAAESAARSAWSAARSAWSAESAARPAWSAESAAYQKIFDKCHRWIVRRTKNLKEE